MKAPSEMPHLQGCRFPRDILACAVRANCRFALGTADVENLLAQRGALISRATIGTWVNRSDRHLATCIRRDRPCARGKWHFDEVVTRSAAGNTGFQLHPILSSYFGSKGSETSQQIKSQAEGHADFGRIVGINR